MNRTCTKKLTAFLWIKPILLGKEKENKQTKQKRNETQPHPICKAIEKHDAENVNIKLLINGLILSSKVSILKCWNGRTSHTQLTSIPVKRNEFPESNGCRRCNFRNKTFQYKHTTARKMSILIAFCKCIVRFSIQRTKPIHCHY